MIKISYLHYGGVEIRVPRKSCMVGIGYCKLGEVRLLCLVNQFSKRSILVQKRHLSGYIPKVSLCKEE